MREITNADDIIDSRDLIARIAELEDRAEWADAPGTFPEDAPLDDDEMTELRSLRKFAEQASEVSDWQYGKTFIRDSYFEEYAEELADGIGAIDRDASWPLAYIDWEAAADALKQDYTPYDFDGVTYWAMAWRIG